MVIGKLERQSQRRRQRRLDPPRLAGQQPPSREPEPQAQLECPRERLRLVGVPRGDDRSAAEIAGIERGRLGELGDE